MDDVTFCAWVAQAAPGDVLIYHRGFLGVDRDSGISTLPEAERRKLSDLGNAAYRAFQSGVVHLVQARLDIDHFAYIAIARPRPEAAAASLSRMLLAEAA
jgi:hypothetical protein